MSAGTYILVGKEPIEERDALKWADWFGVANRRVAETRLKDCRVSTIFLGLNHNYGAGRPLLFETMVFGGELDGEMNRYSTWDEAEAGHNAIVERIKS